MAIFIRLAVTRPGRHFKFFTSPARRLPPHLSNPLAQAAPMLGVRNRKLASGERVTVHHCNGGYWLPDGLPEGAPVTVHVMDVGYAHVLDAHGRQWKVALSCIQLPRDVWWHGEWIDHL